MMNKICHSILYGCIISHTFPLMALGGTYPLLAKACTKEDLDKRVNELSEGASLCTSITKEWSNYVFDKDFHHGDIYAVTHYAILTYLYFIRRQLSEDYDCFCIDNENENKEALVPRFGFSNAQWERELEKLYYMTLFFDEYKSSAIILKGTDEKDRIEFKLGDDGLYCSDNAPYWEDFVVKWAFKFCHATQNVTAELSAQQNPSWSDLIKYEKFFGEREHSLTLIGLISYMRVANLCTQKQSRPLYYFYNKWGKPFDNSINDNERYLKHERRDAIGEDDELISQLKYIHLVAEQVGDDYYMYERQENDTFNMSQAPYWDEFTQLYGSLREKDPK